MNPLEKIKVEIREAGERDLKELRDLALKAWNFTYKNIYSSEYIKKQINDFYTEKFHNIILERCEKGLHIFYVLVRYSKLVGMIDYDFNEEYSQLTRLYLDPEYIGLGYGKMLLDSGDKYIKEKGINCYFVFVHKENVIGKSFYPKFTKFFFKIKKLINIIVFLVL